MLKLDVTADVAQATEHLSDLAEKHIPNAAAKALTRTGVVDARRLSWLAAQQKDMFFETGNSLLAAWGKQTRAHIGLLFEGEHEVEEDAAFAPHPARHLLARLQNAILELQQLAPASVRLAASDRSIEVQVCHSRTRELEVLHDRLLGLFKLHANTPDALRPSDIVVLMPDLEQAAARRQQAGQCG